VTSAADVVPTFVMAVPTACKVWVGDPLPILETAVSRSLTADFIASTCGLYTDCAEVETASRFVLTVSSADWIPALPPVRREGLASAVTDCLRLARAVQTDALPDAIVVVVLEALDFELEEHPATAMTAIALAATRDLSFTVTVLPLGSELRRHGVPKPVGDHHLPGVKRRGFYRVRVRRGPETSSGPDPEGDVMSDSLPSWRETAAKQSILDFIGAVTDPKSADFVPEVDRVAVFDNDGTLSTENPYAQLAFALDRAAELGKPTTPEDVKEGGIGAALALIALTHGSITTEEFDAAVRTWIATARHPRFGRSYRAMVYQPMVELIALLERNEFDCWIFSGGGADFMRAWAPDVFGIRPHRVIGSTGKLTFQIGDAGPELLKGTDLAVIDDKEQKAISIHQAVGQRPILAAGNTDGDLAMLQWTAGNSRRTLELAVHHTDAEREYAYDFDPVLGAGNEGLLVAAADGNWTVIDIAADWEAVYSAT
jgi:haloacid dehalogenase-like hydrolase